MQAAELLSGTWKLVYTANSELLPLLALARLPLTKVGDITQVIDASTQTFQNKVWKHQAVLPLQVNAFMDLSHATHTTHPAQVVLESLVTRGQFSVNARFQVRSPTRLEVAHPQSMSVLVLPLHVLHELQWHLLVLVH